MKKRRLASLIIVSIIAIASVIGVIFAFQNSGRKKELDSTLPPISVDLENNSIDLEIEIEKDTANEGALGIKDTDKSSAQFTITVGGPSSADRSVIWQPTFDDRVININRVGSEAEAVRTGRNTFEITGQNGGSTKIVFVAVSSMQTLEINVTVNLTAKDMKIAESKGTQAHFGIRQGSEPVNIVAKDFLSKKFVFLSHSDDDTRIYTPNQFPVEYRLKHDYDGVSLVNGFLSVSEQATCVDQYIDLQIKLHEMDHWLDIPFYVFPSVNKLRVDPVGNYFHATTTGNNVWDLIANRPGEYDHTTFAFSLDYNGNQPIVSGSKFDVVSEDTTMVSVGGTEDDRRTLTAGQNLGQVAVTITAYPYIIDADTGKEIVYNETDDKHVQVSQTIYIRVRNEFHNEPDYGFNLVSSKNTVNAFFYDGNKNKDYYDEFSLNTSNAGGKTRMINLDSDIEFELDVVDNNGIYNGTYTKSDGRSGMTLFDILQIGYWSEARNEWIMLSYDPQNNDIDNYYADYLNQFRATIAPTGDALNFLSKDISLVLRAKSVYPLSVGGYASCEINLKAISAIDKIDVTNLTEFDDGTVGIALVYNNKNQSFTPESFNVYGMIEKGNVVDYCQRWDTSLVTDDRQNLPFGSNDNNITCNPKVLFTNPNNGVAGYYHMIYTLTADVNDFGGEDKIPYYENYPFTISYINGEPYTVNVRLFPTVEALSMRMKSNSKGTTYQTLAKNDAGYNYAHAVYVSKGHDYYFDIETPGFYVGAYATFDKIYNADGVEQAINDSLKFDASKLEEGIYRCEVSLHAYSDAVYSNHPEHEMIEVYVIVVDPIRNVTVPYNQIKLDGIGDSKQIKLDITPLTSLKDGMTLQDSPYLQIEIAQDTIENKNISLVQGSGSHKNEFMITANYFTSNYLNTDSSIDTNFDIGFKIYKKYAFSSVDLDGDGIRGNEAPFELIYTSGHLFTINVLLSCLESNSITLDGGNYENTKAIGDYLKMVSTEGAVINGVVGVKTGNGARNTEIGIALAKWQKKNTKFELEPFVPTDDNLLIGDVATASLNHGTITITPVPFAPGYEKNSMGEFALVIYARDSLCLVDVNEHNEVLVLPKTYKMVSLYIGSASEIELTIDKLTVDEYHDANSGRKNDIGGYNWILAPDTNALAAVLFYNRADNIPTNSNANVYYFDDLYTVLGWNELKLNSSVELFKYVKTGDQSPQRLPSSGAGISSNLHNNGRNAINLNEKFTNNVNEEMYSHDDKVVYIQFYLINGTPVTFYIVEAINSFDISAISVDTNYINGQVARRNLSHDKEEFTLDLNVQRGNKLNFKSNLKQESGWNYVSSNFTPQEANNTGSITYAGGTYTFMPYIEFKNVVDTAQTLTFSLDELTANVKVKVIGGISSLEFANKDSESDGFTSTTISYELTMLSDQEWTTPNLLNYEFLYNNVYYPLFENNATTSYVEMAGGKAQLGFKLTCLNPNTLKNGFYYTYILRIEITVIVATPDVDPFNEIRAAQLIVRENLEGSPLAKTKVPAEASAVFNLKKGSVDGLTIAHFADTRIDENNRSALRCQEEQSPSNFIYLDNAASGLLRIYPHPYYANITQINIDTIGKHPETVEIGKDLRGNPILSTVTYSVKFIQMVYNETYGYYQPYLGGNGLPKMVSTWSAAEGYKWTGVYYFKTYIESDSQITHRLNENARFTIQISIQDESSATPFSKEMTLYAKYRDGFVVTPDKDVDDYPIRTMLQTQYQALGTTAVYDIALPEGCSPNYKNFTFNGVHSSTSTIQLDYATVILNSDASTISVRLNPNIKALGQTFEVRIPYNRPGDYVNPYLSVVITPVYFEFKSIEPIGHNESIIALNSNEISQLKYRALFNYADSVMNLIGSSMNQKMEAFNEEFLKSDLVSVSYVEEGTSGKKGKVTVQFSYSYVDGVPVLARNGDFHYAQTFAYDKDQTLSPIKRTEYLAVGTSQTYIFHDWNELYAGQLYLQDGKVNPDSNLWSAKVTPDEQNRSVSVVVNLENRASNLTDPSKRKTNNVAYQELVNAGSIVINVFSTTNMSTPKLELTIIPVWFTFDQFVLENNPTRPLLALSSPTTVTVKAGGIVANTVNASLVADKISAFNTLVSNDQKNQTNKITFSRVENDNGILNFNFDNASRRLTRVDMDDVIGATSYLLVAANISYVNGEPVLGNPGKQIATYIPVKTLGDTNEFDNSLNLEPAPNGRTRVIAQEIGSTKIYNIALPGITYDSRLEKYEIRSDSIQPWEKNFGWNASFSIKNNTVTVHLDQNTNLFDKTLVVLAYSQERKLTYVLKIIPAYFTFEEILLANHIDESPVLIRKNSNNPDWEQSEKLDFAPAPAQSIPGVEYDTCITALREALKTNIVSRTKNEIDDNNGYLVVTAGVNYEGGFPVIVNLVNANMTISNTYRYELVDGIPESIKAQAIGQTKIYNVNRKIYSIKIYNKDNEVWEVTNSKWNSMANGGVREKGNIWSVEPINNNYVRVMLTEATSLIDNPIRIGIFIAQGDSEPDYILTIIPAYFAVEDITVAGQTQEDRNIFLYYGEEPDSPLGVVFDAIFGQHSNTPSFQIPRGKAQFIQELQYDKANLIIRNYDRNANSGDLRIVMYINYEGGRPTIVSSDPNNGLTVRLDVDFWFAIYGRDGHEELPPLPAGPRTRTEVQAVGTTASYTLDLGKSLTTDALTWSTEEELNQRGWKAELVNNVFTIELLSNNLSVDNLMTKNLVFKFYSETSTVFVLTIQPVLFEIVGIETTKPEQPINLNNPNITYRAVVKYNHQVTYNGHGVIEYLDEFNTVLNNAKGNLFEIEDDGHQYLKLDIAVDYGVAGSTRRCVPTLIDVTNNSLDVVESYIEYTTTDSQTTNHYQAVGTTEYYYLGADYVDATYTVTVAGVNNNESDYLTVELDGEYIKVALKDNNDVIGKPITIVISKNSTVLTMTINPTWFIVEGFEVINHPERHMWLINTDTAEEKVNHLLFRVRARYAINSNNQELLTEIQNKINEFNQNLASYDDVYRKWNAGVGAKYLETYTINGRYLVVRAAVNYDANGVANIVEINENRPTNIVRDVFEYVRYSNKVDQKIIDKRPNPDQPSVLGRTQANQIIGKTKLYTLKNIKGQVSFQYLWVENAGNLLLSFTDSDDGKTKEYSGLTIKVDTVKNTMQIQLAANTSYVENVIRVYIPYLTIVNGREVWYSHCIEITPLLFELKGWTIVPGLGTTGLVSDQSQDYLLLTDQSDSDTAIRYQARINACDTTNMPNVQTQINNSVAELESSVVNYIVASPSDYVEINGYSLTRKCAPNCKSKSLIDLSTYVVYESGMPKLVTNSKLLISNQILIATGYSQSEWEQNIVDKETVGANKNYAVQAIGTEVVYTVEVPDAKVIFDNRIVAVDQNTHAPIIIPGAKYGVKINDEIDIFNENVVIFTVDLEANTELCYYPIEIQIPYSDQENATEPNHVYKYYITPAIFTVDGFYLKGVENNVITLIDQDVILELRVSATYSDELKNRAEVLIENFENLLNSAIRNKSIIFNNEDNIRVPNGNEKNVQLQEYENQVLIKRVGNVTALNYLVNTIKVGYTAGVPRIGGVDPKTDTVVDLEIQVKTEKGEIARFPGWDYITRGNGSQNMQAIGTSSDYPLENKNSNIVFYYENIKINNGGILIDENLENGERTYETFNYGLLSSGRQHITLRVTFKANARALDNDIIEICIPYTDIVEGKVVWYYYSLQIKPVLFEITSWKLKSGDDKVDSVTLDNSAFELYFTPEYITGPLTETYYALDEITYIKNVITKIENEINQYDAKYSDGYQFLVINNTAQPGYQVNYTIFNDINTNTQYLLRNIPEASTTIMQVSASILYDINSFKEEYPVNLPDVVTPDSGKGDIYHITSEITINTTDKTVANPDSGIVFITQENAHQLKSLNSGVKYMLMSDIYLYDIDQTYWTPVSFPTNTVLDGNNYKIFFSSNDPNYYDNSNFLDLSTMTTNIGMFTIIPKGSVVENLQIVIDRRSTSITTFAINLINYAEGTINVGLLAGLNEGIITNCAVLSDWQFNMRELKNIINPVTGEKFNKELPFNGEGYLFDENYFYKLGYDENNNMSVIQVYNSSGYSIKKENGEWHFENDELGNIKDYITPDRTNVANYENYSPMIFNSDDDDMTRHESPSPAKLYVYANNKNLNVVIGGLVGSNNYMITNSRVLIDVELYGPEYSLDDDESRDVVSIGTSIVGGFVGVNSGTITTSFFRDGSVINNANADPQGSGSMLGGFVGQNNNKGIIQQSYAMGRSVDRELPNFISGAGVVKTTRNNLGGFVYLNSGTITDCLVNVVVLATGTKSKAAGFVYQNTSKGIIKNCIENNNMPLINGKTDYYIPFICENGDKATGNTFSTRNLSNLIYAGNTGGSSITDAWNGTLKGLYDTANYLDINNYSGFSIGATLNWEISDRNTIWKMTDNGPMLRVANDIAVSCRKYTFESSPYLYNQILGTEKNPYLVWNEEQFNEYVYGSSGQATAADSAGAQLSDIENNYQYCCIRLVDNVVLNGIKDTCKIIYKGTLEGNGLTMSGIGLATPGNQVPTFGLFGKTEYATIRNINFKVNAINSTARYVGGIAGIAINTNFVDVSVSSDNLIQGDNIVGGFVGLNVVFNNGVENYNLTSSVSVAANFQSGQSDEGASNFTSGVEYCRQTLFAEVKWKENENYTSKQGFSTAGGVFGFVTSNPNNYKTFAENGEEKIVAREFVKIFNVDGRIGDEKSKNKNADWFLKTSKGEVIDDYFSSQITLRNISGSISNVKGNVVGGLIGIMDETIELHKPKITKLSKLTGKYYLGGLVGINLGKISGDGTKRDDKTFQDPYDAMTLSSWNISSSAGDSVAYVYRDTQAVENAEKFWGMTVGAVAGYNNGVRGVDTNGNVVGNNNSGVIENINIDVNVLTGSSNKQYVVGGVVGANGDYGVIDQSNNLSNTSSIQIQNATQAKKVGFYYGRIIGRSDTTKDVFQNSNKITLMDTFPVDLDVQSLGNDRYIVKDNFSTRGYNYEEKVDPFDIIDGKCKIQTMTKEEYYTHLKNTISGKNIVDRVKLLQPWVRSLPTTIEYVDYDESNKMYIEKYDEEAKSELLQWLKDEKFFEDNWGTPIYNNALNEKVYNNYVNYLEYSATVTNENIYENQKNIGKYRDERYRQALELFTYQYQIVENNGKINGPQNSDFKWYQYEDYLKLKKTYQNQQLGDATEFVECKKEGLIENVVNQSPYENFKDMLKNSYKVDSNGNYEVDANGNLVFKVENGKSFQFSNKDPLQVYINYVVALGDNDQSNPFRIGNMTLSLSQYYYYMGSIYGNTYEVRDESNKVIATYKVPKDFAGYDSGANGETSINYVMYVYTNSVLLTNETMYTIPKFINLLKEEINTVSKGEETWIKTGHLASGGARISTIGAFELNWTDVYDDWYHTLKDEVQNNSGVINYTIPNGNGDDDIKVWNGYLEYMNAKKKLGLTITKYDEIISLGGSLHDLIYVKEDGATEFSPRFGVVYKDNGTIVGYEYDNIDYEYPSGADEYIFALKSEQYGWTLDQNIFIKDYLTKDGVCDYLYALSATTTGNILKYENEFNKGSVRAVYVNSATQKSNDTEWWSDLNGYDNTINPEPDSYEPRGVSYLIPEKGAEFINGDGKIYYFAYSGNMNLMGDDYQGAAMYIDVGADGQTGNKMFGTIIHDSVGDSNSRSAGNDILLLYEIGEEEKDYADFYTGEEIDQETGLVIPSRWYKIVRQIIENTDVEMTDDANEHTGNKSDYLEEAAWWYSQRFTAQEFDQIKYHAMTQSLTGGYVEFSGSVKRSAGYTLADDWFVEFEGKDDKDQTITKQTGFKKASNGGFTPSEYTKIVLGAKYIEANSEKIWYSTYADYLLFSQLYDIVTPKEFEFNNQSIVGEIPATSQFNNPLTTDFAIQKFIYDELSYLYKSDEKDSDHVGVAGQDELKDAMPKTTAHKAFLEMFEKGGSTADYFLWATSDKNDENPYYGCGFCQYGDNGQPKTKYFRINHYIYYKAEGLFEKIKIDGESKFNGDDFRWVLTHSIRENLDYNGITQKAITDDLVEYRLNWWNDGSPFITFRDYCEWINIYKYDDTYQMDRGDFKAPELNINGEQQGEEQLESTDGWLTLESFAVWKRMEKYENSVEYLAHKTRTPGALQKVYNVPILKRQISTTVLPRIHSSGNQKVDENTGLVDSNSPYTMQRPEDNFEDEDGKVKDGSGCILSYYNWGINKKRVYTRTLESYEYTDPETGETSSGSHWVANINDTNEHYVHLGDSNYEDVYINAGIKLDSDHIRHAYDRYEYNEQYVVRESDHCIVPKNENNPYDSAGDLLKDNRFLDCDCPDQSKCNNPLHKAYQMERWTRYGETRVTGAVHSYVTYAFWFIGKKEHVESLNRVYFIVDETNIGRYDIDTDQTFCDKDDPSITYDEEKIVIPESSKYLQLYISFDTFKEACQRIKVQYSDDPDYNGYHNYMKYWARNGEWNWICHYPDGQNEYDWVDDGQLKKVDKTYLINDFWNEYDGSKSPLDGKATDKKAYGWRVVNNNGN